jgi:hypothetical protein
MIKWIENGDIFESQCDILVNPVNCVGPMGRGLAKEFAKRYPLLEGNHRARCEKGEVKPGYLWVHTFPRAGHEVLNFPTKDHWRKPSEIGFIITGLQSFCALVKKQPWSEASYAFPPLGCGLGGLKWADVKPLIEQYLGSLPINVEVYCPHAKL